MISTRLHVEIIAASPTEGACSFSLFSAGTSSSSRNAKRSRTSTAAVRWFIPTIISEWAISVGNYLQATTISHNTAVISEAAAR